LIAVPAEFCTFTVSGLTCHGVYHAPAARPKLWESVVG
jgi:hypothetical protein